MQKLCANAVVKAKLQIITTVRELSVGEAVSSQFGAPYAVMHRADLVDVLHKACKRFANIDILFGVRAYDVVSHARGITVTVDEADGKSRSALAHAFVGGDGAGSHTRTLIMQDEEAAYSGYVAWRTTLPIDALKGAVASDRTTLLLGPGYHAVCYPLPYRNRMNVALFAKEKQEVAFGNPPSAPRLPWAMLPSRQFQAIMKAAEGTWGYWIMSTVSAERWHDGGVGLIGDAAHAMLPFQAQGAVMAIEDAAILAPLLMTEPEAASALACYEALRRPRVERVAKLSRSNGFAFHLEWPFTIARDLVIATQGELGHLKRLGWLYSYDPAPEPSIAAPPRTPRAEGQT
jgi:salicylate hydroxylase